MKALLIIDIQNDFLPGGALAVPGGDEIIDLINELQPHFELVVATQDWHPANHGSFASAHFNKKPFETTVLNGLNQVLWPDHCIESTFGAQLASKLSQTFIEAVFRKGTNPEIDSYSGFFDNGKKKDTGLGTFLKGRGISQVFVAGLAGDYCVGYTALDAIDQGFSTSIIEDATRAIDPESFVLMKKNIIEKGGRIIQSADIL